MIEVGKACLADGKRIADIQVAGWQAGYRGILPDSYLDRLNPEARVPVWGAPVLPGGRFACSIDPQGAVAPCPNRPKVIPARSLVARQSPTTT